MSIWPQHMRATTTHARRGHISNTFRYGVDFVLIDPEASDGPALFSRNRFNLATVHDRHHGGPPRQGRGTPWAREAFSAAGLDCGRLQIMLLTQPAVMGLLFNPVSFWLAMDKDQTTLRAVIAEVTNTSGGRHSYLCHLPAFAPITADRRITATNIFHVSPFQEIAGGYHFRFSISRRHIAIRIHYENGPDGVTASLGGPLGPMC